MRLFSSQIVKLTNKASEAEKAQRIAVLNAEESKSAKRLNEIKESERLELERLEKELEAKKLELAPRKSQLEQEVDILEARKLEALKPVLELVEQANEQLRLNAEQGVELVKKMQELKAQEKALKEREEILVERERKVVWDKEKLGIREGYLIPRETEIERLTKELAQNTVRLNKEIAVLRGEFEYKLALVESERKANEIVVKALDARTVELNSLERAINDKVRMHERNLNRE